MEGHNGWPEKVTRGARASACVLLAVAACLIAALGMTSCSTARQTLTSYGTTDAHKADTIYIVRQARDSVYCRDSVYVREKSDTVYMYVEKWRVRVKTVTDTLYLSKVDSMYVETRNVVEVERELTRWQRFRLSGFWVLSVLAVCCLCVIAYKNKLKVAKAVNKFLTFLKRIFAN